MWNNTNPAELFSGTTWELITSGKYIQSGNTSLSTGGSNSISISKANLPNVRLSTGTATATIGSHFHYEFANETSTSEGQGSVLNSEQSPLRGSYRDRYDESYYIKGTSIIASVGKTSSNGNGTTGSFSLQTETLGSGTPLNIQPNYITLKFWKRLT